VRGMSLHFSLVVESNSMDADRNMHVHYITADHLPSVQGVVGEHMLASRAYSTARATSTHKL
jgi:hypothetical protein